MKKLQWNMKEVFYFPENVGVPKEARLVKVKAGFTEKRSEDAVRLSGIYHIAAKVGFTDGQRSESIPVDAVFVDDVEMEGETGYFEYAVPLYIDLPPEVEHPLHIEATDIKSNFDGQGSFTVAWNVNCMHGSASEEETASNEAASASKETVSKETSGNEPVRKEAAAMEVNEESEVVQKKKEPAAVQVEPVEKAVAAKQEHAQSEPAAEPRQPSAAQSRTVAAPVQEPQATAMNDSSLGNSQDDILSYIAALPDEWTTTRFRSNDIFVKEES